MEGTSLEHSDSDSGESWTLLDNTPCYADEAPSAANQPPHEGDSDINDKDEDTDGISIISDSDPESAPCEIGYDQLENPPTGPHAPSDSVTHTPNSNLHHEPVRGDDILGDNHKLKTYVHRRNKRLSTVLNIIVLGSVITAAGVAIGHMWGAKNDCFHATPSVNKILSNLYKLQEENAYLRNKLKELTLATNIQILQRKDGYKQRCKKVFEESLDIKNPDTLTKCVDNEYKPRITEHQYEKDFLADIDKLKITYQQNKSWLDEEISKRMKHESQYAKRMKTNLKSPKSISLNDDKYAKHESPKKLEAINELPRVETEIIMNVTEPATGPVPENAPPIDIITEPEKVSYADTVRLSVHTIKKREVKDKDFKPEYKTKVFNIRKRRPHKKLDVVLEYNSDDEVRKDDRHVEHRLKPDRKKNDRQKINKKQKRRNKYEQWEMKGGYMKDYDDFSISSAQENDFVLKNPDKNILSRDFEKNNYIDQFSDENFKRTAPMDVKSKSKGENNCTSKSKSDKDGKKGKEEANWYEKRVALRIEARKKLGQELFGDSTPNASWYFRRMQKREQCRVKEDNSTHRKANKRAMNMNFKTKN